MKYNHVNNLYLWIHSALAITAMTFFLSLFSAGDIDSYSLYLKISVYLFAFSLPLNIVFSCLYKSLDLEGERIAKVYESWIIKIMSFLSKYSCISAIFFLISNFSVIGGYVFGASMIISFILSLVFIFVLPAQEAKKLKKVIPSRAL